MQTHHKDSEDQHRGQERFEEDTLWVGHAWLQRSDNVANPALVAAWCQTGDQSRSCDSSRNLRASQEDRSQCGQTTNEPQGQCDGRIEEPSRDSLAWYL